MPRRVLLLCGILSPLLYAVADALAGMRWQGYSFRDQVISELGAIGAPSRPLFSILLIAVYLLLVAAWGSGSRLDSKRRLRVVAGLLVGLGIPCAPGRAVRADAGRALAVVSSPWFSARCSCWRARSGRVHGGRGVEPAPRRRTQTGRSCIRGFPPDRAGEILWDRFNKAKLATSGITAPPRRYIGR